MKLKKILLPFLACLLLAVLLAGCNGVMPQPMVGTTTLGGTTSDSTSDSGTTNPGLTSYETLTIDGTYKIVHQTGAAFKTVATNLKNAIKTANSADLSMIQLGMLDSDPQISDREIIIGNVVKVSNGGRPGVEEKTYAKGEFDIVVTEQRIVIMGGTTDAIACAVDYFIGKYVTGKTTVTVPGNLNYKGKMPATDFNVGSVAASNMLLLGGASTGTSGVTFASAGDGVAFKATSMEDMKVSFSSSSAATFKLYINKGESIKDISVAAGQKVDVTLLANVNGASKEYTLVKTSGAADVTLTTVTMSGDFETKPALETTATKVITTSEFSKFKSYGRCFVNGTQGVAMDYSGSGLEFNIFSYAGGAVTAQFVCANRNNITDGTYIAVFVDGVKTKASINVASKGWNASSPEYTEVTLAENLTPGFHTIRVIKITNLWQSYTALSTVSFKGAIAARPANAAKYIEFVGDSITCGYGTVAGAENDANPGYPKWCDVTKSYSFKTATTLGADYSICGYSGYGLDGKDTTQYFYDLTTGQKESTAREININQIYIYRNHSRGNAYWNTNKSDGWHHPDNNPRIPDLIVVNLGTNDDTSQLTDTNPAGNTAYVQVVKNFIQVLRDKNGQNVPILWTYGAMKTGLAPNIKQAITELQAAGDNNVYYLDVTKNTEGGGKHPSDAGQTVIANEVVAFIRANISGFAAN